MTTSTTSELAYPCGFALVNNGKHCVIFGRCVVCRKEQV
jgi:hypothetical protein